MGEALDPKVHGLKVLNRVGALYTGTENQSLLSPSSSWDNASLKDVQGSADGESQGYPALMAFAEEFAKYHGYIAAIVCIWGIVANLANIVVLTRKNMVSQTNLILTWLAVADLLTMTSYFPVSIHFYILRDPNLSFPASTSVHWIRFMLFHINFSVVAHTVAIWLTITLAIFRYLFICFPTRGSTLCSMQRVKMSILAVYICVGIICIPNYLTTAITDDIAEREIKVISSNTSEPNVTTTVEKFKYYHFNASSLAEPFLSKFNYWIQAILIKLIPCILLVILTILLIVAMHRANQRRAKLKSQGRRDESDRAREHNRTTAMLLAIVALFLLTEVPQGILTLCSIFIPRFFDFVYWPLGDLLDLAALLNNSINFVLYCLMSRQFRDTFVQIFCGCCPSKNSGWLKLKTFTITSNGTNATQV